MAAWLRQMSKRATLGGLLLAGCLPAQAASLIECRALAEDSQRLACYDTLAPPPDALPSDELQLRRAEQLSPPAAPSAPPVEASLRPPLLQATTSPEAHLSMLGHTWELDPQDRGNTLRVRPYKPVYILPFFHTGQPNTAPTSPSVNHSVDGLPLNNTEAKLQISLKTKLIEDLFGDNGDLWFGYTQSSRWQVYNPSLSRPFRETNHEPEFMFVWRTDYRLGDWRWRMASLGINHQSNGRSLPLSRSWNRVIAAFGFENEDWAVTLRPWWRIPEKASQDDNPDISHYLGRGDLQIARRWGRQQLTLLLRHNLRQGSGSRGAAQFDYAFPIAGELRGHLQWFSGYGESMIDYNHRANYYGIGVSLVEWY